MIRLFRFLLFPFAVLYFIITEFRNFMFRMRIMRGARFDRPVICVGNLSTGGTGKSPMIEYLVRLLLKEEKKLAILSRGYGRITNGYLKVENDTKSIECGDEPLQFKHKFQEIDVAVCERRVDGIIHLIKENKNLDLILLDDAFQHQAVKPSFSIQTTSFYQPFFMDFILPVGNLREMRRNAIRANAIVITKCPDGLTEGDKKYYRLLIQRYSKAPVFFSKIKYGKVQPVFTKGKNINLTNNILLVTGIADASVLEEHVKSLSTVTHLRFSDHHRWTENDMEKIAQKFISFASDDKIILTTEKDAKRLQGMNEKLKNKVENLPFYFIEMEQEFLPEENENFDTLIIDHVRNFK